MPITKDLPRLEDGTLQAYAWPGGYPLFYVCKDNSVLCTACADKQEAENKAQLADPDGMSLLAMDILVGYDINYEDADLTCDKCSQPIECAYCD